MSRTHTFTSLREIRFPILCVDGGKVSVERDAATFTVCSAKALKDRWYQRLVIVDSRGKRFRVLNARKLHGVGLFAGYNVFFNRRLRVELELVAESDECSLSEVKTLLLKALRHDDRWISRGDSEDLQSKVKTALSVQEAIQIVE